MRTFRTVGSVREAAGNRRPYRDPLIFYGQGHTVNNMGQQLSSIQDVIVDRGQAASLDDLIDAIDDDISCQ